MPKKRRKHYSRGEREELKELYRQSGYSIYRFCKEMNLGYETLKRWLEEERPKVSLVEVTAGDAPPTKSITMTIRLPNGIACELGITLSMAETLNWVRELKAC
jgi:transposase-like protein